MLWLFPVPPPKFFAYINPIQLCLDHLTVLWLNAFSLNLQQSVKMLALEKGEPPYLDVKIEAIMFRVSFHLSRYMISASGRPSVLICGKVKKSTIITHVSLIYSLYGLAFSSSLHG